MSDELGFLGHQEKDSVAVAVRDVEPGVGTLAFLDSEKRLTVNIPKAIPLGHKVALVAIPAGSPVIEYGETVGVATQDIAVGELVHVHNIRSNKWQTKA
ncbi:UxaA family hydrolase [Ferrimicrobium acidiphilum]|uniref:UxaA family hydrolase n=1 Tax=Ferrimicrobium acidiphilum TaxID=121039 RepID=UPI0023F40313|nr:UxaA family hydrolase [Ferrimicrobium acidiphilum]